MRFISEHNDYWAFGLVLGKDGIVVFLLCRMLALKWSKGDG